MYAGYSEEYPIFLCVGLAGMARRSCGNGNGKEFSSLGYISKGDPPLLELL